jgi:hypothetical protein
MSSLGGQELNWFDQEESETTDIDGKDTSSNLLMNSLLTNNGNTLGIANGSGEGKRTGRRIIVKQIHYRAIIQLRPDGAADPSATTADVRI